MKLNMLFGKYCLSEKLTTAIWVKERLIVLVMATLAGLMSL